MNEDISQTSSNASADSNKMNPVIIGIIVLVIALIGFYALRTSGNQNSAATDDDAMVTQPTTAPTTGGATPTSGDTGMEETRPADAGVVTGETVSEDGVRTINMEAGSFYYTPNEIRVKKGETVRIVMSSVDMMHDFKIDELDVSLPVTRAGETNTVEFTADTVGEFEFYCTVGQHRANGQVGTLIVEE